MIHITTTNENDSRNVAIVRCFLDEVVNGGRQDLIDELWTTDMVWQGGSLGEMERDTCQDKNTSQKNTRKSLAKKLIHDLCKNAARSAAAVIQMPIPVESGPGYTRIIKMRMHLFMRPNPVPTLPAT